MKLVLLGDGRMGTAVAETARTFGHEVLAMLGRAELQAPEKELARLMEKGDVAIDFTVAEQVPRTVLAAAAAGVDLVVGTTGWKADAVDLRPVAAAGHGVVHGSNFSLGVHMYLRLVREAARLAGATEGYDVHVDEVHHRHKRDHPSGTGIRAAEAVLGEIGGKVRWAAGPPEGPPDPSVLYITSVRTGEVPGVHVVGLEGPDDRIEIRHEARSRTAFAQGAVRSAEWIHGRRGVHTFEEVAADLLDPKNTRGMGGSPP